MSRKEKLIKHLLSVPKDLTFDELKSILKQLGYSCYSNDGSKVRFLDKKSGQSINLHKPHPSNILKPYQLRIVIDGLKKGNKI